MKTAFRVFGLTLVLVATLYSTASASIVTCYYFCRDGRHTTSTTFEACCGGSTGNFPCPDGTQGSPYGYNSGLGPKFC
jgi:hypothetical protein